MLFFWIERKEDNIYDFFAIQEDSKVVWFTGCPAHIVNLNLLVMLAEIIFGILCIVYFCYLISILPVFLGVLLMIESVMYFITAFCVKCKLKVLIVILSLLVGSGGVMLVIFTFGFGGLRPLVTIFSSLLFLSCITELLISSCGKA